MRSGIAYDEHFFLGHESRSRTSADRIAAIVSGLVDTDTVVDVGCGIGTWLAAFKACGSSRVLGLDGDYVPRDRLQIDHGEFVAQDLREPLVASGRFDLALSLEVAEHLPSARGPLLVAELVGLAPAVLFSAAIPRQGGTDHVNERWQNYWAALFVTHGYRAIDCVRPVVWDDPTVEPWYGQNTLLYIGPEIEVDAPAGLPLRLVHPGVFLKQLDEPRSTRQLAVLVQRSLREALRDRPKRRT